MMPPPGLQICLRPRVTLTFDLLNTKVNHFVPLPRRPLAPICIKITSFVFEISSSQVSQQTNERTDGQTDRSRT